MTPDLRRFLSDSSTTCGLVEHGLRSRALAERQMAGVSNGICPPELVSYVLAAAELLWHGRQSKTTAARLSRSLASYWEPLLVAHQANIRDVVSPR
jgi:hypothetical protein